MKNITINKSTVTKKYLPHCPAAENHSISDWFELYQAYREHDYRCVEVYSVDQKKKTFEMQRVEGFTLNEYSKIYSLPLKTRYYIIGEVSDIFSKFFKFAHKKVQERQLFMHMDMHVANLMYTDNGKIVLIDPDSFSITYMDEPKQVFYGRYFDSMIYLKECLTK
jgi:thiamine kinase-like enzyme